MLYSCKITSNFNPQQTYTAITFSNQSWSQVPAHPVPYRFLTAHILSCVLWLLQWFVKKEKIRPFLQISQCNVFKHIQEYNMIIIMFIIYYFWGFMPTFLLILQNMVHSPLSVRCNTIEMTAIIITIIIIIFPVPELQCLPGPILWNSHPWGTQH